MWTAPQKTGFQAIVVHWADADTRQVESALLSLKEFKGSHGGEEQAKVFMQVIEEAGLQKQLGFFTMDNATSNDKMLSHIADEIENFDPILRRVRCFGHVINLVIQAFLFGAKNRSGEDLADQEEAVNLAIQEVSHLAKEASQDIRGKIDLASKWRKLGSLGKLHNINIWIRASTERYQSFVKAVGRAIPLDNDTRWNSWSTEIEVALEKRRELRDWIEEHWEELGDDILSRDDWQELEDIKEFMQPFVDCTLNTQGIADSLDTTFTAMEFFVKHFNEMKRKHQNNPQINARVMTAWFKFDRYYKLTDETAIYVASVLLHPELRKQYLEKVWAHQPQYINSAVKAARKLWTEYFKPESVPAQVHDLDAIQDPIRRWRAEMTKSDAIVEEFNDFIKGTTIPIGSQHTALEWWLEPMRQTTYPNLSRMAITIFTIAPMSAGPERVFSGAKHTIAPERVSLGAAVVEMTECLKSWVRISPGRQQAPLSGVFRESRSLAEATEYLQKALEISDRDTL
jgi:hAT family C-terminal dimerisation region